MQTTNLRHLLHLYRHQVVIIILLLSLASSSVAQHSTVINLPNYTEKFLHYGFGMGLHSSRYAIQYSDAFAADDTLHSVVPHSLGGFKIGFISNMRVLQYLDFRFLITVGFYENKLLYRSVTGNTLEQLVDATTVELPMLLKYRSVRRDNIGMYLIGGITPTIEARGKDDKADASERLLTKSTSVALEAGVGFDLYYPLFKFAPEIRYSWGISNILTNDVNKYNDPLKRVSPHNLTLYITFEGGPS
ncbi:MAG: outer membrane beta-barrel protein [Imperialibacter sp.]|uniref:type IX secretion/gliding motility protein PorT/SprT n=1 Tax=Imperialibacter sp. TaxID=2038411 RepID=UPI0032ECAB0D